MPGGRPGCFKQIHGLPLGVERAAAGDKVGEGGQAIRAEGSSDFIGEGVVQVGAGRGCLRRLTRPG